MKKNFLQFLKKFKNKINNKITKKKIALFILL